MSDTAAQAELTPPPDAEGAAPETPVTDWQAEATEYKNRFSGSQKRLNEEIARAAKAEKEAEELRAFKAQQERASMTELDRLKAERQEALDEAAKARTEAARAKLALKFPLATEALGDAAPTDEAVLARLEERLKASAGEPEPEPMIDPNLPRRTPAEQPEVNPLDEIDRALKRQAQQNRQ